VPSEFAWDPRWGHDIRPQEALVTAGEKSQEVVDMKRVAVALLIVVVAACTLTASASARGSTNAILDDATDGVVNGTYTAAQVRAALSVVRSDPVYSQYSDIEGVLVDYLASVSAGAGTTGKTGVGSDGQTSNRAGEGTSATSSGNKASGQMQSKGARPSAADPQGTKGLSTDPGTRRKLPAVGAWDQVGLRFAAVPWLFVALGCALLVGVVLFWRRPA
jgi:hypothetical protein